MYKNMEGSLVWSGNEGNFVPQNGNLKNFASPAELTKFKEAYNSIEGADGVIDPSEAAVFIQIGRKPEEANLSIDAKAKFIWLWRKLFGIFPAFFNPLIAVERKRIRIKFQKNYILVEAENEYIGRMIGKGGRNVKTISRFFQILNGQTVKIKGIKHPSFFGKWCRSEKNLFKNWRFFSEKTLELEKIPKCSFVINCKIDDKKDECHIWKDKIIYDCSSFLDIRFYDEYQYFKSLEGFKVPKSILSCFIRTRRYGLPFGFDPGKKIFFLPDIEGQNGEIFNLLVTEFEKVVEGSNQLP